MPYKKQELLTLREHLCSLLGFGGVCGAHPFSFCVMLLILFVFVLFLVCPVLSVSLDCPFLIVSSVFSNVYLGPVFCVPNVVSVSRLSILDCLFGFL